MSAAKRDQYDGIEGSTDSPDTCPECGELWSAAERVQTGDESAIGGYEDWCYCKNCETELFYPVVHRPMKALRDLLSR